MTKRVEVYFKNENDAESAKMKLQPLKVTNIFVDKMPVKDEKVFFFPFVQANLGGTEETKSNKDGIANEKDLSNNSPTHMLQFDVEEEDYEASMNVLKQYECYSSN